MNNLKGRFNKSLKLTVLSTGLVLLSILIPYKSFALAGGGTFNGFSHSLSTFSFNNDDCLKRTFFGLEPWYYYLPSGDISNGKTSSDSITYTNCDVKCFNVLGGTQQNSCGYANSDIPYVLIAVTDDLLRIAGLAAVGFVIYGAFKYVGSQGNPDGTAQAQSTIINALIGLAIASAAVFLVNFIGNRLGG